METDNLKELQSLLDQVTRIKLEALKELTHEELRSDQTFTVLSSLAVASLLPLESKASAHTVEAWEELCRTSYESNKSHMTRR